MEPTPRLKKRRSWTGNIFRNVAVHGALTAKAAVDSVRERIGPSPMPALPEPHPTVPSPKKQPRISSEIFRHTLSHRRTYSAKSALASIRSHIPRRSLDVKRHSFSDLLYRSDSHPARKESGAKGEILPSDVTAIASGIALPSSPINVPDCAPSLSLDLGPMELLTGIGTSQCEPDRQPFARTTQALETPDLLRDGRSPTRKVSAAVDSVLMDQQSPVAEARESLLSKLTHAAYPTVTNTPINTPCQSPLPGTNLCMEFDEHDFRAASVKEPDSVELTRRLVSSSRSLDALASTPAQPATAPRQVSAPATADVPPYAACSSSVETSSPSPSIRRQPTLSHNLDRAAGASDSPYSGPPSPDRSVILAIRTKQTAESGSPERSSPISRHTSCRSSPHGLRSDVDLTVALLRERTNDASPLLERFARLYESSRMMDGVPTALSSTDPETTADDDGTRDAVTEAHPQHVELPAIEDPASHDVDDAEVGVALTTDWQASSQPHEALAFPLQSYVRTEASMRGEDTQYRAHPITISNFSSSPSLRAIGPVENHVSAWTDLSSMMLDDESVHDQLSVLINHDDSSFIEGNEDVSSLLHY